MWLRTGEYWDAGMYNRMIFLLLCEVNRLHDAVYMFGEKEKEEQLLKVKRHLNNKINTD